MVQFFFNTPRSGGIHGLDRAALVTDTGLNFAWHRQSNIGSPRMGVLVTSQREGGLKTHLGARLVTSDGDYFQIQVV